MAVVFVEGAETMILVDHVVDLQLRRPAFPDILRLLRADPFNLIRSDIVGQGVILQRLAVTVAASPQRGSDVETTRAVVHVKVVGQRMTVLIHATEVILKTDALTLCFLQRNAHYGLCRGSIAGTGVLHYIDVLYLVGAQTREFLHVLHPAAVDIYLGITAPQHLHATVALRFERGNLRQGIAYRSGFLQYRTSHRGPHGVALYSGFRQTSLYHHATQFMSLVEPLCRVC